MRKGSRGGGTGARRVARGAPGKRRAVCGGAGAATEGLQHLKMEGSQRRRSAMVSAEAAEVRRALRGTRRSLNFILWVSVNRWVSQRQPNKLAAYVRKMTQTDGNSPEVCLICVWSEDEEYMPHMAGSPSALTPTHLYLHVFLVLKPGGEHCSLGILQIMHFIQP